VAASVTANIVASGGVFRPSTVTAKAGSNVAVILQNDDPGVTHDLVNETLGSVPACTGASACGLVSFRAPPAGSYTFHCSYYPDMTVALNVLP
jgi:plastocyanin